MKNRKVFHDMKKLLKRASTEHSQSCLGNAPNFPTNSLTKWLKPFPIGQKPNNNNLLHVLPLPCLLRLHIYTRVCIYMCVYVCTFTVSPAPPPPPPRPLLRKTASLRTESSDVRASETVWKEPSASKTSAGRSAWIRCPKSPTPPSMSSRSLTY